MIKLKYLILENTKNVELDNLTNQLKSLTQKRFKYEKEILDSAIQSGELLIYIKQMLNHGEFTDWISRNIPFISMRTAQNWMTIARAKNRLSGAKNIHQAYILVGLRKPTSNIE